MATPTDETKAENTANPTDDTKTAEPIEAEAEEEELIGALTSTTAPPIVLDNGGGILKCGLSNSNNPFCVQSLVGTPKHLRVMLSSPSTQKFFGHLAYKYRGLCKLSYPIQNGIVSNWTDMIQLWQYLHTQILQIDCTQHPILLTEAPKNPISNRIRTTQIYLEYFDAPSVYFTLPNILALYSTGRLSGCVFDSGFGVTSCVPIIDGFSVPNAITRMNMGGYDITKYLSQILSQSGDYNFQTTAELQTVRIIKEKECILSEKRIDKYSNPLYDSHGIMGNYSQNGSLLSSKLSSLSGKLGSSFQTLGIGSKSGGALSRGNTGVGDADSPQYTLPDGTILNIGNTHQRCAEILFDPTLIGNNRYRGIQYLVMNAIAKCDISVRNRLFDSLYLTGGNCNIRNFAQRLINELKGLVKGEKRHNRHIKIKATAKEKHLIPFIGGTLLASQSQFKDLWITKEDFNEYGTSILFRNCLC